MQRYGNGLLMTIINLKYMSVIKSDLVRPQLNTLVLYGDRHKSFLPPQSKQSVPHLSSMILGLISVFSLLISDLGLDQFIVKRYDGKVRNRLK